MKSEFWPCHGHNSLAWRVLVLTKKSFNRIVIDSFFAFSPAELTSFSPAFFGLCLLSVDDRLLRVTA
jgi:hypothetical protein